MTFARHWPAEVVPNYLNETAKDLMVWQLLVLTGAMILQTDNTGGIDHEIPNNSCCSHPDIVECLGWHARNGS